MLLVLRSGRQDAAPVSVTSPAEPQAAPSPSSSGSEFSRVEPSALLGRARARAATWHEHAELVLIEASPVVSGNVDVGAGGTLDLVFGKPTGARLGPGAPLGSERLAVRVTPKGLSATEDRATAARAVADPSCPMDEAWQKIVASGVPSSHKLSMRYARSDKHDRAVWKATALDDPKLTRTLDGASCVILVR